VAKIHRANDTTYMFWCPACNRAHAFNPKIWTYNGDEDKPTVSPSILVHGTNNDGTTLRCHSFVTDGKMHFTADCSHSLAGEVLKIPEWVD